jgi:hypothetical protein
VRAWLGTLVLVLLASAAGTSVAQDPELSGFSFAVLMDSKWTVYVTEEDIAAYELQSHTVHLTDGAIERLGASHSWRYANWGMRGGRFQVRIGGEEVYTGSFSVPWSSSNPGGYPSSGPWVDVPVLNPIGPDSTRFSILFAGGDRDPRADARIVKGLRRAGVLVE